VATAGLPGSALYQDRDLKIFEYEPPRNQTVTLPIKTLGIALISVDFRASLLFPAYQ
jgi:hypothetical protein